MGNVIRTFLVLFSFAVAGTAAAQLQGIGSVEPSSLRAFHPDLEEQGGSASEVSINVDNLPVVYPIRKALVLHTRKDVEYPYLEVAMRSPVFVVDDGDEWLKVRTLEGATGFVRSDAVSDFWIKVAKKSRTVRVYRGDSLYQTLPADLAINFFSDKVRRGGQEQIDHWRTPEGTFFVVARNPESQFHKAFVLNYPGTADAERGLLHELITQEEHDQIVRADTRFEMPPMSTALGGYIEIHGDGTGARTNWTRGCIAIRNADIDALWDLIQVGTPVLIVK